MKKFQNILELYETVVEHNLTKITFFVIAFIMWLIVFLENENSNVIFIYNNF